MNYADNISRIGNYRYRPSALSTDVYRNLPNTYDASDLGNYYTDATYADVVIDGGVNDDGTPTTFISRKQKESLLYSLEDCFGKFRPRSGINKLRYFENKYTHHENVFMAQRPRFYMGSKDDKFKYWSSYRTENGIERGISSEGINNSFKIDDAVPFVVYKEQVAANRIIIKMQTKIGTVDLGNISNSVESFPDPFFGDSNKETPSRWKVQYLDGLNWVDAISFNETSTREDGSPIIGPDGHVELQYGIIIPEQYKQIFVHVSDLISEAALPAESFNGASYLIKASATDPGTYYIWIEELGDYYQFPVQYGWFLGTDGELNINSFVDNLTSPDSYINPVTGKEEYRQFLFISGLRIVVESMTKQDAVFDLIELSPRLAINMTDKVSSASLTKIASDIGESGIPVGDLLVGNGSLSLFDYDLAFYSSNSNSIISNVSKKDIQFKFYEGILDVNGYNYYVPIKTMYSDTIPETNLSDRTVDIELRDLYFYFESLKAPQILIQEASLSYAVALLLDSIGFSNYVFYRTEDFDPIIPYFYIKPDVSVAEILKELAISTQSAMFFDEYNNLVVMTKEYMLPSVDDRSTDIIIRGSTDFAKNGILSNEQTSTGLANIIDIASTENTLFNSGTVNYNPKHIQRSYSSISQSMVLDSDKTWVYTPALLWQVSGTEVTKSINQEYSDQAQYVLSAIPLNTDLTDDIPYVENNTLQNNILDFGEGIYYISRYSGFFYAGGEIIKYDAVEFSITSATADSVQNVWVTSNQEYQGYFSKLPFNGKMYPTGRVRIYAEPNYEIIDDNVRLKNGEVAKHGRGQFGTEIVSHFAGIDQYWLDDANAKKVSMTSRFLFTSSDLLSESDKEKVNNLVFTENYITYSSNSGAGSFRSGIIKNFLSTSTVQETELDRALATQSGMMQASALTIAGEATSTRDDIYLIKKNMADKYKHFGTRVRIIGTPSVTSLYGQAPLGAVGYYDASDTAIEETIGGSGGGIGILINPANGVGYYYEITALTDTNIDQDTSTSIHNVMFYKFGVDKRDADNLIPKKLWGGLASIITDTGDFTGQARVVAEENTSVYDLAIEYENLSNARRFYLYLNDNLIATVDDDNPSSEYNNAAMFVRGPSKLMFENFYALGNSYQSNAGAALDVPVDSRFGTDSISISESLRKYSISGMVQSTYLSGISPLGDRKYNIYYDEFGTIMREAAYFNIKYDKAYPALYAKLSPTFSKIRGYNVAGFIAGSYGAEFIIFNATDTLLSLDESTGNYLRIQGVTFTQNSEFALTMDDYFSKNSDLSNPTYYSDGTIQSPFIYEDLYKDIKQSRLTHGVKEFTISGEYIQSLDDAESMMSWLSENVTKPRKSVGVEVFGMPILQLGDIVQIDYKNEENEDIVAPYDSRFVIYHMEYGIDESGPKSKIYLSEVI